MEELSSLVDSDENFGGSSRKSRPYCYNEGDGESREALEKCPFAIE